MSRIKFEKDTVVEEVLNKFKERSETGLKKYGVTLDRDDLTLDQWLEHLQEELMDAVLYIQKVRKTNLEATEVIRKMSDELLQDLGFERHPVKPLSVQDINNMIPEPKIYVGGSDKQLDLVDYLNNTPVEAD